MDAFLELCELTMGFLVLPGAGLDYGNLTLDLV
jgi:hypothetical protein